jgi:hypothetical protein
MINGYITTYRDTPKSGETDAKWCGYISANGHITVQTTDHETQHDARIYLETILN